MPIKIVLSDFGINPQEIPQEVYEKYNSLSKSTKFQLERNYGSAQDYVIVLYHLWFIEKQQKSAIAEKFDVEPSNIHTQLYNFHWGHSDDYANNKTLFEEDLKKTKNALEEAKISSQLLDANTSEHSKLKDALNNAKRIHEKTYQSVGFKTKEEYIRVLYYSDYKKHKQLSLIKLIPLFNLSYSTLEQRVRILGLNLSHEEGIASKKERGSQDYEASNRSAKKTIAEEQLKKFAKGSKPENYVRTQLANFIHDPNYLDSKKYEVVIGANNTGILGSLEIDIPIMVYEVEKKQLYRFVIEYSGDYYHFTVKDENKKLLAESKGWHYLEVRQTSSDRYSNKRQLLNSVVHELCKSITTIVESDQ